MGTIQIPARAKLFIGIIGINEKALLRAQEKLRGIWGETDLESGCFPFDQTRYYEKEMGPNLLKKFLSFRKLVPRESIVEIKIRTNGLEEEMRILEGHSGRVVNLDPGYITLSHVALATTKDYRHRIYLDKGIYLENTLYYDSKKKTYADWDWTYPDYRTKGYKDFFLKAREIYKSQIKSNDEPENDFSL